MKTCAKCNLNYPDEKKFCKNCGESLVSESKLNPKDAAQKSVFEDKLRLNPLDTGLLKEYAQFLYNKLLFKDAITVLLKILAIDENDSFAPGLLYKSYKETANINDAIEIGQRLLQSKPDDIFLLTDLADMAIQAGKGNEALAYLERIIEIKPNDKDVWVKKANILSQMDDDLVKTHDAWLKVYELSPDNIKAKMHIGIDACKANDFKKADELLESVITKVEKIEDKNKSLFYYVYALIKTQGSDKAVRKLINEIDFSPFHNSSEDMIKRALEEIYIYRAEYELSQKNYDKTIEIFEQAYQINKTENCRKLFAIASFEAAKYKYDTDEFKSAGDFIAKSIEFYPDNEDYKSLFEKINILKNSAKRKVKLYILLGVSACVILGIVLVYFLVIMPYLDEKNVWEEAKKTNTVESYSAYLDRYQAFGRYADEAYRNIYRMEDSIKSIAIADSIAAAELANEIEMKATSQQKLNTETTLIIKGNRVNIRTAPSTNASVIMQLNTGDVCEVLEKGNSENINGIVDYWYKINFNGKIGWVFGSFTNLSSIESPTTGNIKSTDNGTTSLSYGNFSCASNEFLLSDSRGNYRYSSKGIYIKLLSYENNINYFKLTFRIKAGEIKDLLLFATSTYTDWNNIIDNRLFIVDDLGKKYISINGFEGGNQVKFNDHVKQIDLSPTESANISCKFPAINQQASTINFYSPALVGWQGEWKVTKITLSK
ncbi:MAG TPA: SH3 domain-containing protein [Bacteroidales bacterium]|nr:SH3 domain-containing protein [Bacteroidales bacterium]